MTKKTRSKPPLPEREAQFDIAAHQNEIDRLLRENAKLKAKNLTLERELLIRPPYSEREPSLNIEAFNAIFSSTDALKPPGAQ